MVGEMGRGTAGGWWGSEVEPPGKEGWEGSVLKGGAGSHVGRVKSTGRPRMEESCWSMVSPLRNRKSQFRKTSSTGGGGGLVGDGWGSDGFRRSERRAAARGR